MTEHDPAPIDLHPDLAAAIAYWGRSVQLSDDMADTIFDAVVATPVPAWSITPEPEPETPLDPGWWRRHSADLAHSMVSSTRWVPAA